MLREQAAKQRREAERERQRLEALRTGRPAEEVVAREARAVAVPTGPMDQVDPAIRRRAELLELRRRAELEELRRRGDARRAQAGVTARTRGTPTPARSDRGVPGSSGPIANPPAYQPKEASRPDRRMGPKPRVSDVPAHTPAQGQPSAPQASASSKRKQRAEMARERQRQLEVDSVESGRRQEQRSEALAAAAAAVRGVAAARGADGGRDARVSMVAPVGVAKVPSLVGVLSRADLRRAIVMREVLQPPISIRTGDELI